MQSLLSRRDFFRALLVAFATLVLGLFTYDLFAPSNWRSTHQYGGDSLEILARLKLAAETDWGAWLGRPIERLGAPFSADWGAYPQSDQWIFWLGGKLTLSIGLIPTSYVLLLSAHVLGAVSFFLCARALRHRPIGAACFAVLFGLSHFSIFRGLTHFSFALTFLLPPMLTAAWWIASARRLRINSKTISLGLALALIAGAANPYFIFIFLQLLAGSLLIQLLTARRQANLIAGFSLLLATGFATTLWNTPALWARLSTHATDPLIRSYAGSELYSLKPVELFVPPPSHHIPAFADFGRYYGGSTQLRGELFSPYLGIVAAAGLLLIAVSAIKRLADGRGSLRPSYAPWTLWFLLVGGTGGFQALISLAGVNYFRATNRYSVLILTLSLFFLSRYFSRAHWLRNRPALSAFLALSIAAIGLWDQIPPSPAAATRNAAAEKLRQDITFASLLEKSLPARARVFQLPAVAFPEQPAVVNMTDYAHLRPFLFSHSLRFSYGALVGSPEANWSRWAGSLPPLELVTTLQAAGFNAITINRSGYKDRATALLATLASAGYTPLDDTSANPEHIAIRLHPTDTPQQPDLDDPRLLKPWYRGNPSAPNQPEIYATRGWLGFERYEETIWRWAGREATATLRNPGSLLRPARIQFEFASNKPGSLTLTSSDKTLWSSASSVALATIDSLQLDLPPGTTELVWRYEGPLARPPAGDDRKLGFKIQNLRVTYVE